MDSDDAARTDRPRVVVSVTSTPDGQVALNRSHVLMDDEASSVWQSIHPPSAGEVEAARESELARLYHPEVVLEGSGTFVPDSTGPLADLPPVEDESIDLYTDFLPADVDVSAPPQRWFAVVDGRGRVRWTQTGGGGMDLLVLVCHSTPRPYLAYLRRSEIPYLVAGDHRVDLLAMLRRMADRLGVSCVVSRAGGGLNGALLRAGLIDEVQVILLPALIGGLGTPTSFDGPRLLDGELPTPLRLLTVQTTADGVVWLRYEVERV